MKIKINTNIFLTIFKKIIITFIFRLYIISSFCITRILYKQAGKQDLPKIKKILIVDLGHIGDVIRTMPLVANLKAHFPNVHISFVTGSWAREVVQNNSNIDNIFFYNSIFYQRNTFIFKSAFREIINIIKFLKGKKYDLMIEIRGDLFILFLTLLHIRKYKVDWEPGYVMSNWLGRRGEINILKSRLNLLNKISLDVVIKNPIFQIAEEDKMFVRDYKKNNNIQHPMITISFSSGGTERIWPRHKYADLINLILKQPSYIILIGNKNERILAEEILLQVDEDKKSKVFNAAGKTTLREAAAIIQESDLLICNDSAAVHIADALNVPTIALFGPTEPNRVISNINNNIHVICSPDKSSKWKDAITTDIVAEKCHEVLWRQQPLLVN